MGAYLTRRLLYLIPVLLLVGAAAFFLMHLAPGDPAMVMLGADATPEQLEMLRRDLGLDRPLAVQFALWLGQLLRGNLGTSLFLGRDVLTAVLERVPATFTLALVSLAIAVLIGLPCGVIAAVKRNTWWDQAVMAVALVGVSVPSFWMGLFLMLVFAVQLRWFPSGGYVPFSEGFWDALRHLVLPGISLGLMQASLIARMARSSMLEVLREDFVRTAHAKGLLPRTVVWKHALKNAMIPILTVIGLSFGVLLGGAVVVETVFSYPGLGRLVVLGVQRRDYALVQGSLLFVAFVYIVVNFLVDVLYAAVDPRIRYS